MASSLEIAPWTQETGGGQRTGWTLHLSHIPSPHPDVSHLVSLFLTCDLFPTLRKQILLAHHVSYKGKHRIWSHQKFRSCGCILAVRLDCNGMELKRGGGKPFHWYDVILTESDRPIKPQMSLRSSALTPLCAEGKGLAWDPAVLTFFSHSGLFLIETGVWGGAVSCFVVKNPKSSDNNEPRFWIDPENTNLPQVKKDIFKDSKMNIKKRMEHIFD